LQVTDWFQDSLKEDAKQAPRRIKMQVRGNGDGEEDGEKGRLTLSKVNCVKRCNIHEGDNCYGSSHKEKRGRITGKQRGKEDESFFMILFAVR
jgi:hypothetical protein